jgi:CRP-like cAMP-binding protein
MPILQLFSPILLDHYRCIIGIVGLKRNEPVLNAGEARKFLYFIVKGCLQVFVYDRAFNETTRENLLKDNWFGESICFCSRS